MDNSLRRKQDPLLAAGLIGGVGSLIGSLFSSGSNAAAVNATNRANMAINKMNNQFNHDENTLAYNRQRQLISEQNEYNSFANQRKLMEQAGYNPNNLVGGTAGTAVSSSSTATNAASAAPSHAMQAPDLSALGNIANIGLTVAQTKLMEAQASKTAKEAGNVDANAASQRALNESIASLNFMQRLSVAKDVSLKDRNIKLFDETFEDQKKHVKLLNDLTEQQISNFKAQAESIRGHLNIDQNTFDYMVNTMWPAQVEELQSRTGLNRANATAALMNAYYYQALGVYTKNQNSAFVRTNMNEDFYKAAIDRAVGEAEYWKSRGVNETNGIPYVMSVSRSYSANGSAFFGLGSAGSSWQTFETFNPVTGDYKK